MTKRSGIIIIFIFVMCVSLATFIYQYKSPQYINKTFNVVDLNGIYVNIDESKGENINEKRISKVNFSLVKQRKFFSSTEYTGNVILNNIQYNVLVTGENGSYIVCVHNDNKPLNDFAFTVFHKNDFNTVLIQHPNYVLVGPAETVEEAIREYKEYIANL